MKRFVDARWINQRMDAKDRRVQREAKNRAMAARMKTLLTARGLYIEAPTTHAQDLALIRTALPAGWSPQDAVAFINAHGVDAYLARTS
jgi:hypothetical protein